MLQRVMLVGNLGADPEMRFMPGGDAVTNFRMATNRKWTTRDGVKQEEAIWWNVEVWGKSAENCNEYLKTGSKALVEGRLKPARMYEKDGVPTFAGFEIVASQVTFL